MGEQIVFISHFRVKEGEADGLRDLLVELLPRLKSEKPRTASQLMYLSSDGRSATFVHVFPDASAMATHFQGSDERSASVARFIELAGFEVYGDAPEPAIETLRREAAAAGAELRHEPNLVAGFLRGSSD